MIGWVVHRAANIFLFLRFVSDYALLCPALRICTPSIYQASIDRVHNWFLRFSPHSSKFSRFVIPLGRILGFERETPV